MCAAVTSSESTISRRASSSTLLSAPGDAGEKGDKGDKGEDGVGIKGSPGAPGAPGEDTSCFVGWGGGVTLCHRLGSLYTHRCLKSQRVQPTGECKIKTNSGGSTRVQNGEENHTKATLLISIPI